MMGIGYGIPISVSVHTVLGRPALAVVEGGNCCGLLESTAGCEGPDWVQGLA